MSSFLDKNPKLKEALPEAVDYYKLLSQKQTFDRQALILIREAAFIANLEQSLKKIFANKRPTKAKQPKTKKKATQRILNLLISDTHYRSMINPNETPNNYGPVEECRRTAAVIKQACEYKLDYRANTALNIHLLGDIIQNQLHDERDGQPLAEQAAATISTLTQAIIYCNDFFPEINVHCTSGNHGRNTSRHTNRGVHQKWDSIETIIYSAVKTALIGFDKIKVSIPRTPYYTVKLFDNKGFFTHGDTILNCGYPGGNINVKSIRQQVDEWNVSKLGPFKVFAIGHVHTGSVVNLHGGSTLITNGCLCPSDNYSLSLGTPSVNSGQYLFESTPDYAVGDIRFIQVDESTDSDKALDGIITPFSDF